MTLKPRVVVPFLAVLMTTLLLMVVLSRVLSAREELLSNQLQEALEGQSRIAEISRQFGYAGFIHNFKNYVLRADSAYYDAARANAVELEALLRVVSDQDSDYLSKESLISIQDTLLEYTVKLELVRQLHNQGLSVEEIDSRVRVDDHLAASAMRDVIVSNQVHSARLVAKIGKQLARFDRRLLLLSVAVLVLLLAGTGYIWVLLAGMRVRLEQDRTVRSRQRLLDAAPNPILIVTEEGMIEVANAGAGSLMDCASDQLIGRSIEEFVPDTIRAEHLTYRKMFFNSRGERSMRNPVTVLTATKQRKRVEVLIGLYELNGQRYAVVNLLDVSRVEDMERRTSKIEEQFRVTFELAPIGIAQVSLGGRFVQVNRQMASIMGYSRKEMEDMSLDDVTPADERNANRLLVNRLINRELDHLRLEKRYLDRNGHDLWVTLTMTLCRDAQGNPDYLISIFEDISYRKSYEEELLASEAKFKSIANHVNGVVWMATPGNEKILFVNNRYPEIWGRSIDSLMRDPDSFMEAVLPEDRLALEAEMENHRKGIWNVKYRIRNREGDIRYIHDEGLPVRNASGDLICLVGMARDVTEEHVARARLEHSNRQLEQLAKFDPLTMAVRRPYALADLDECVALFKRYETEATLVFIDLNDFKSVNDQYGHEAGDQVLVEFARCVRQNIRETDGFYRYAGDEFLLLLRETDNLESRQFLDKFDRVLSQVKLAEYPDVQIKVSCGAVTLGEISVRDANDWIRLADTRMYEHKKMSKAHQHQPS